MSDGKQHFFGGAFPTPGTDEEIAQQREFLDFLRNISAGELGHVPLDPLNQEAMEIFENWPPYDQGKHRSTCVAFAVLAMIELQEYLQGGPGTIANYSEEFLYSKMRRKHAPNPLPLNYQNGSTFLSQAAAALETWGICDDADFPYVRRAVKPDFVDVPSTEVKNSAIHRRPTRDSFLYFRLLRREPEEWRKMQLVSMIRGELAAGNPVAATFPIYFRDNQWTHHTSSGWRFGAIDDPSRYGHVVDAILGDGAIIDAHAVCIVGYREDASWPGGRFLFRNSWGARFARKHSNLVKNSALDLPRVGYGTISAKHVEDHCWELMFKRRASDGSLATH